MDLPEPRRRIWLQILPQIQELTQGSFKEERILALFQKCSDMTSPEEIVGRVADGLFSGDQSDDVQFVGPINQNTSTASTSTAMDVVPYEEKNSDLATALQNSIIDTTFHPPLTVPIVENPLEMLREPGLSAGLHNSGNTCWFNCITQMLFAIPKFRSLVYHAVPGSWLQDNITNVQPEFKLHAELLVRLRALLAELQFTERRYLVVDRKLLMVIDQLLQRKPGQGGRSTIGHQQDVSEMLTFIMEWTLDALKAAIFAHRNPDYSNETRGNRVVEASTSTPPNNDVTGTVPPVYQADDLNLPSTSNIVREPRTRENSPVIREPTPKKDLEPIVEDMDVTEPPSMDQENLPPVEPTVVSPEMMEFSTSLKTSYDELFAALRVGFNEETMNKVTEISGSPELITLAVQQGNLHDALECYTCSTDPAQPSTFDLYRALPDVIFLGLNRYKSGIVMQEKADNPFEFPQSIFMDRYLEENIHLVRELRKQRKELRERLSEVRAKLKGLSEYPHGADGTTKLIDAFQTVREAIGDLRLTDQPVDRSRSADDTVEFVRDVGKIYPTFAEPHAIEMNQKLDEMIQMLKREENECLRREEELKAQIKAIFDKEELQKVKYDLYTVIVHAGALNQGHYWTYKKKNDEWEKINDNTVERVEWTERTQSEFYGKGNRNDPSAYVLMYMRSDSGWLLALDSASRSDAFQNLPIDLQSLITTKEVEFQECLKLFRDYGCSQSTEAQTGSFSWYGRLPMKMFGDENANPLDLRRDTLDSGTIPVLEDDEIQYMDNQTHYFWNMINTMAPGRFKDRDAILSYYLKDIMDSGGWKFIESQLGYPIVEMNPDAVNDISRAYDIFTAEYMGPRTPDYEETYKSHSRFLFLCSMQMIRLEVPLVRYILVCALCHSDVVPFAEMASRELGSYVNSSADRGNTMLKITQLMLHMFDMRDLLAWNCRVSMDCSLKIFDRKTNNTFSRHEEKVNSFTSLVSCRNARVSYRFLKSVSGFMDRDGDAFVVSDSVEVVNIAAVMSMMKSFFEHFSDRRKEMTEMEFHMPHSERRIRLDDIVRETKLALNGLVQWKQEAVQRRDSESEYYIQQNKPYKSPLISQERRIHLYDSLSGSLTAKLECFASGDLTPEKHVCVGELLSAIVNQERARECVTHLLVCDAGGSEAEKIDESIRQFGDVFQRVDDMLRVFDSHVSSFFVI